MTLCFKPDNSNYLILPQREAVKTISLYEAAIPALYPPSVQMLNDASRPSWLIQMLA